MGLKIEAGLSNRAILGVADVGGTLTISANGAGETILRGGTVASGAGTTASLIGADGVGSNRTGGSVNITGGNPTGTGNGGTISLTAGALQGAGTPGSITITGGAGSSATTGGAVNVVAGTGGTTGAGATLTVRGGAGGATSGNTGDVTLQGGTTNDGTGGDVILNARSATGTNRAGGIVNLITGNATGSGTPGVVTITGTQSALLLPSGSSSTEAIFTTNGNLRYDSTQSSSLYQGIRVRESTGGWMTLNPRERLTGNRTYYVRTDGSNSNTGLVNNSGGAWLTLQRAWDQLRTSLDLNGFSVTVQIGDGTYTGALRCDGYIKGQVSPDQIIFQGNTSNNAAVVLSVTSNQAVYAYDGAMVRFRWFKVQTTTSGNAILADRRRTFVTVQNMNFGTTVNSQLAAIQGAIVLSHAGTSYTVSGGAQRLFYADTGALMYLSGTSTWTLTGTPAFSQQTILSVNKSYILALTQTFSGSATGTRYLSSGNSVIHTNGGGANYFPGNAAGSVSNGGQYI